MVEMIFNNEITWWTSVFIYNDHATSSSTRQHASSVMPNSVNGMIGRGGRVRVVWLPVQVQVWIIIIGITGWRHDTQSSLQRTDIYLYWTPWYLKRSSSIASKVLSQSSEGESSGSEGEGEGKSIPMMTATTATTKRTVSLDKPGTYQAMSQVAEGTWKVIYAPHMTTISNAFGGTFDVS